MSHAQEGAFVRAFVRAEKQDRWTGLLANPRRRSGFLHTLADSSDIDERWAVEIPSSSHTPTGIVELLRHMGASDQCRIISEIVELDGKEMGLSDAIERVWGTGLGSVVLCEPGTLAYYEGEYRHRFVLQRRPPP